MTSKSNTSGQHDSNNNDVFLRQTQRRGRYDVPMPDTRRHRPMPDQVTDYGQTATGQHSQWALLSLRLAGNGVNYDEWAAIGHANAWLGVRRDDSTTSKAGAKSLTVRAGSQRASLLSRYAVDSMTDEEAGHASGLAMLPKCCYWKRCSELRQAGYIETTGVMRRSSAGVDQHVCSITQAGHDVLGLLA